MSESVIKVSGVSKKFCRTLKHTMLYGAVDLAKSFFGINDRGSSVLRKGEFWAVHGIDFELKRGECFGIIGSNGAGKSTILKMLNGIVMPDEGYIEVRGKVGALIEVGAGFHPMLTGRENIYINGTILGMSRREIDDKFDAIVEFADMEEFLDTPIKHYSSGMYVRLGFSVAIHSELDILLVDEVLAVGDMRFQRKCLEQIEKMRKRGITIILISHNLHMLGGLCERSIYLNDGKVFYCGSTHEAIIHYQQKVNQTTVEEDLERPGFITPNFSSGEILIERVDILDEHEDKKAVFSADDKMIVRVLYTAQSKIVKPVFSFGLYRDDGVCCCGDRTLYHDISIDSIEGAGIFEIKIKRLQLTSGSYIFGLAIFDSRGAIPYGYKRMGKFVVTSTFPNMGVNSPVFLPDFEWKRFT